MPKPEKEQIVESIAEKMQSAKSVFLTDYSGLNVEQMTELRNNFRKESVEYHIYKNTLTRLSVKKIGYDNILPHLTGPLAIAFGMEDPIAPARVIKDFSKELEKPTVKAGIVEGEYFDVSQLEELVNLPTRDQLIGQVVSGFAAPLSGLVGALNGITQKLVFALNAIKEKKEQM